LFLFNFLSYALDWPSLMIRGPAAKSERRAKKVLEQQVSQEQASEAGNQNAMAYTNQLEDMRQIF